MLPLPVPAAEDFNSRPSARGDESFLPVCVLHCANFNSRPSARGDSLTSTKQSTTRISIHAPPRGATPEQLKIGSASVISIHAPPRGATRRWRDGNVSANFNSRPSARGDQKLLRILGIETEFQFTPLREGRPKEGKEMSGFVISIHAPPRGATAPALTLRLRRSFQFTPLREGRRFPAPRHYPADNISIHAPPRGATVHGVCWGYWNLISIHAPPRGATAKDMQFLQIFCSTLTNQHGLTIVPRNLSRLFW